MCAGATTSCETAGCHGIEMDNLFHFYEDSPKIRNPPLGAISGAGKLSMALLKSYMNRTYPEDANPHILQRLQHAFGIM